MKKRHIIRLGIFISLVCTAMTSWAQPVLNGLAESVELNKERFIAGLYTTNPSSDVNDLLRNDGQRRMELRITANRLSARALSNMWIEGMAINNPSSQLRTESESLSQLVNMIRKSLVQGDILQFDAQAGNGMTVTLNGIQLGRINSDDFFSMVLRTWIGNVPLSSDFKDKLLGAGDVNSDLRSRYEALSPSPQRIATVEGWSAPAPPPQAPAAEEVASNAPAIAPPRLQVQIEAPTSVTAPARNTTVTPPPANETVEALRQQNGRDIAAALPANRRQAELETEEVSQEATPEPEPTEPTRVAQVEPTPPSRSAPAPAEEEIVEDDEEEVAFISAESIFDRQMYISNVLRKTQKVMVYPDRALRREQEGTVRVTVTLDKAGKLLGTVTAEETRFSSLNRAALQSFEKAEPFDEFPQTINEEYISFTIPVIFEIRR